MLRKRAYTGAYLPLLGLVPVAGEPLTSDAWPVRRQTYTVTFPAARHRALAGTKLYCLGDRGTCMLTTCPGLHWTDQTVNLHRMFRCSFITYVEGVMAFPLLVCLSAR